MEITAAKDIIFALASSGVCVAYARGVKGGTNAHSISFKQRNGYIIKINDLFPVFGAGRGNHRLCFLNVSPYEVRLVLLRL